MTKLSEIRDLLPERRITPANSRDLVAGRDIGHNDCVYKIGNRSIELSEEESIKIIFEIIKDFSTYAEDEYGEDQTREKLEVCKDIIEALNASLGSLIRVKNG